MPKVFPHEERMLVFSLAKKGNTNVEISRIMKEKYPDNWSSKYAHRSVPRILKEASNIDVSEHSKTLDEMTREERFRFIDSRLTDSPRFKIAFKNFDPEQKELFISEYLTVIKSTETLTEVEEQSLFAAILELVLAFQALNRKEKEEKWRDQSLNMEIKEDDPRYRTHVDDKYQREYDQHMKLYQKSMSELKMSRSQRLKEVRSQKQTLVDLAEALSNKNVQSEVASEIERLQKLKDEELKKMLENGYLYGVFNV